MQSAVKPEADPRLARTGGQVTHWVLCRQPWGVMDGSLATQIMSAMRWVKASSFGTPFQTGVAWVSWRRRNTSAAGGFVGQRKRWDRIRSGRRPRRRRREFVGRPGRLETIKPPVFIGDYRIIAIDADVNN